MGGKLVNRIQRTTTFRKELDEAFVELSNKTLIPKSKLLDKAIELLLKEYKEDK